MNPFCVKNFVNRQRVRTALIIFSFILMPVTFAYISCPIIIEGASKGIATGGLIVFTLLFISSLFLGRLWCGWLCPAGGLQEIYFQIIPCNYFYPPHLCNSLCRRINNY